MLEPVRVSGDIFLDILSLQAVPVQVQAHAQRSLAPGGMKTDEIFHITPVVEQFLGAQGIDGEGHDVSIVTLLEELAAQIRGGVIAPRQRIERENPCRASVLGLCGQANQGVTPL